MAGKGDKRRRGSSASRYVKNWERIFAASAAEPTECPACKEIELRPMGVDGMWECSECKQEVQIRC